MKNFIKSLRFVFGVSALSLLSLATPGRAAIITFDQLISGQTRFEFDGDNDGFADVVFTTTDPFGFNTVGPGPNQQFIDEPGIEGTTLLNPDLRVDFVFGVTSPLSFGVAMSTFGNYSLAGNFSIFDRANNLLGSANFGIQQSGDIPYPESQVSIASYSGVASYGLFDFNFQLTDASRYIIDNFEGEFGSTDGPGTSPSNPKLPDAINDEGGFEFEVIFPDPSTRVFIDPFIAIGYEYKIIGDLFDEVIAPSNLADTTFDLLVGDATCSSFTAEAVLIGGTSHIFSQPVNCFRIEGIDIAEMLDPSDTTAFVTGISTFNAGTFSITQTPITSFVGAAQPVPAPLPLFGVSAAFSFSRRLRRRIRSVGGTSTKTSVAAMGLGLSR